MVMSDWAMPLAATVTLISVFVIAIVPTRWGIHSVYGVFPDARGPLLAVIYYTFGFRTQVLYLKNNGTWYRIHGNRKVGTAVVVTGGVQNPAWLDKKLAEWNAANGL